MRAPSEDPGSSAESGRQSVTVQLAAGASAILSAGLAAYSLLAISSGDATGFDQDFGELRTPLVLVSAAGWLINSNLFVSWARRREPPSGRSRVTRAQLDEMLAPPSREVWRVVASAGTVGLVLAIAALLLTGDAAMAGHLAGVAAGVVFVLASIAALVLVRSYLAKSR